MKLAACYTVFNGLELLEKSIEQIYPFVDMVIICYQTTSNKGNTCDKVEPFIYYHFAAKNKVKIIKFSPDLTTNTKENERKKHQLMLHTAKNEGCSHFFLSATDHFYHQNEFFVAKKAIENSDFDVTFTKIFTYYKHIEWQLTPIEDYHMPFIMKIHPQTQIEYVRNFPVRVDPSVQVNTFEKWHLFPESEIMMHHYSMIRENIRDKFKNAAASIRWKNGEAEIFANEFENYNINLNPGIKYFSGRKIKTVPNYFNIPHLTDKTI
jgi:hypothetical protein